MKIALSIENMSVLKFFIAADAVAVLTQYNIRAAEHHLPAGLPQPGRWILAVLFAAVIDDDDIVRTPLCLPDVLHGFKFVKGPCAGPVLQGISILVFAYVYHRNSDAVLNDDVVLSGCLNIFANTGPAYSHPVQLPQGVLQSLDAKVKDMVVAQCAVGNARLAQRICCTHRPFQVGSALLYGVFTVSQGALQVENDPVALLKNIHQAVEGPPCVHLFKVSAAVFCDRQVAADCQFHNPMPLLSFFAPVKESEAGTFSRRARVMLSS